MPTSNIAVGESSSPTKRLATYQISEDSALKEIQRVTACTNAGVEITPVLAAQVPASLGQKNMASSMSTVIASDQTVPVNLTQVFGANVDTAGIPTKTRQDYLAVQRYFVGSVNPTIGTAVALGIAAQNAYSITAPNILISAGAKPVTLERISLNVTGVGTGITAMHIVVIVDTAARYSSGGTAVACKSILGQAASTATVRVGTATIVASGAGASALPVYRSTIKPAAPALNDVYNIEFGSENIVDIVGGQRFNIKAAPLIVPANGSCLVHIWGAGQTAAPTYEGQIYFIE